MNILYLFLLLFLSFFLNKIWRTILPGKLHYILMIPGMIIHEVSHILGCFLVGARVKKVRLFSKKGGYVVHSKPRLLFLGKIIVALAPIVIGGLLSLLIANKVGLNLKSFSIQKLSTINFWIFFILVTSILIEMIPSKADLKNAVGGFIFILLIGGVLYYFEISNLFYFLLYNLKIRNFFLLIISLEVIILVLILPIYLISRIFSYNK